MPTNTSQGTVFNPEVKDTQDPFYLNLSRPISDLKNYGTGTSELLKGTADVLGDAVNVAHTLTQQGLKDEEYQLVEEARRKEIGDLDATLYKVSGGKVGKEGGAVDESLVAGEGAGVPGELQNIAGTTAPIQGARKDGRLSRTDYAMRLDVIAKDLRSRYPGWRDYIDSEMKSITGMDPANAIIAGRIADINSYVSSKKTETDKINDLLINHYRGEPEMVAVHQLHKDGKLSDNQVLQQMQIWDGNETRLKHLKTEWALVEGDQKNTQLKAEVYARELANNIFGKRLNAVAMSFGFGSDPTAAAEAVSRMTPDQKELYFKNTQAAIDVSKVELRQRLSQVDPTLGRAPINDLAPGVFDKAASDASVSQVGFNEGIMKNQAAVATFWGNQNEATLNKNTHQILTSDEIGASARDSSSLLKLFGPNATQVVLSATIDNNLNKGYASYRKGLALRAANGSANPETGRVPTLSDDISDGARRVDRDPTLSPEAKNEVKASLTKSFLNETLSILNPELPKEVKNRYIERAFSPAGRDLLRKIENDGVRPDGTPTKGKWSVYNQLFSPEMSQQVYLLGREQYNMYKDAAKSWFQRDLLAPDIARLNQIALDPDMKITYDDKTQKFGLVTGRGINFADRFDASRSVRRSLADDPGFNASVEATQRFLDQRLNPALYNYKLVAGRDEEDVNAFIYGTLKQMGFGGVDKIMLNAVETAARQRQQKVQK